MLRIVSVGRPRLPPVTGTPIEKTDANTRAVFGDCISIYDIQRAVADKATVPIYYESRISKLSLPPAKRLALRWEYRVGFGPWIVTDRVAPVAQLDRASAF